ncbi:MAG: lipopolysaccharide biosynthesis protein [Candidatus Latescibacterota bacterium]|nr:MAG: lipopolysaccharide biosynthesis protein [Candidatus Latescibacterota bacterium]
MFTQSRPPTDNTPASDPERFLRVDHLGTDLRGRSVRGGAVTLGSQGGKFLLTLGSTAILARILTPEDFGLIAMVIVIIGFIGIFKDMGLAMATVQRAEINHGQVSTLFWLNLAISIGIMAITSALAPLLAAFYKEPRVTGITVVLAITIIFSGLTVQHQALLRRQMRFAALAVVEVSALLIGAAVAITCGLAGFRYWSLVILHVVREIVTMFGVWVLCGWRPGAPVRKSGVRSMIAFGAHLTGFNIVNYVARNVDKMLIGWYWGAAPLGLYNNAYRLLLLPIQQINVPLTSVAVPTLSRLQEQRERYRAYYRRGVLLTVAAGMPIVAFLFVAAEKAVLTFLGSQWLDAVAIFRAFGPAAFIGTFNVATGWVYVSLGTTRRQFAWGIFGSAVTVLAYVIALPWGPIGVAAAFSVTLVVLRFPSVVYCFRRSHLELSDLGVALWRPAMASLAAGGALFGLNTMFEIPVPVGVGLALDFVFYAGLYLLVWLLLPGGRQSIRDILEIARDLRQSQPNPRDGYVGQSEET